MGKRIKEIYDKALTYENMYKAYLTSKRGKNNKLDVIEFSLNYEERLKEILQKLSNQTYTFGKYKLFYIYEPKERKILSAPFTDRIVHTWYVQNFIYPYFVPSFNYHSYACIKEKGMHKCTLEVVKGIKKYINKKTDKRIGNNSKHLLEYILKMDIAKYFENIDREILQEIICKKVKDKKFLQLTKQILDTTKEYDIVYGKSLPIGNYTSQMFANIYLNELDKYMKETLKVKYMYRYMDDVVAILPSKQIAKETLDKVTIFLNERLKLKLNSKTNIFKISQGVNFCGYKIKVIKGRVKLKLRNRGKKNVVKKIKYIRYMIKTDNMTIQEAKRMLSGHNGYMSIADVQGIVNKYF